MRSLLGLQSSEQEGGTGQHETDDGFQTGQIVKKAELGGIAVDADTEDVLKEFNFLTQSEVR